MDVLSPIYLGAIGLLFLSSFKCGSLPLELSICFDHIFVCEIRRTTEDFNEPGQFK